MSNIEIWEKIALPIIQFLVGPVVTGTVIYKLTNKRNHKLERENSLRQMNVIRSKLSRVISLMEAYQEESKKKDKIAQLIEKMEQGDFTGIKHENFEKESIEQDDFLEVIDEYYVKKDAIIDKIDGYLNRYSSTIIELRNSPKDNLPPLIHNQLIRILDKSDMNLDLDDYSKLINEINKLT